MLGFVRARAALTVLALLAGLLLGVSFPAARAEAKTSSSKKAKKAASSDEPDLEITSLDTGTSSKPPAPKKSKKKKKGKSDEVEPEEVVLEEEPEKPREPAPEPAAPYRKNWLSLTVQQELLAIPSQSDICDSTTLTGLDIPGSPEYSCHDAAGVYQGPVVHGFGNTVVGGVGLATTRILVGYERVFIDRLTLGGRLGWAFRTVPSADGAEAAIPFHFELRSALYFGSAPFESPSLRPFLSLGAGLGEVSAKVKLDVYPEPQGPPIQLDAWRRTGRGFVALGAGAAQPIGDFLLNGELRAMLMLGTPAFALGIALGGAYGF
jgi:hypothetical protein